MSHWESWNLREWNQVVSVKQHSDALFLLLNKIRMFFFCRECHTITLPEQVLKDVEVCNPISKTVCMTKTKYEPEEYLDDQCTTTTELKCHTNYVRSSFCNSPLTVVIFRKQSWRSTRKTNAGQPMKRNAPSYHERRSTSQSNCYAHARSALGCLSMGIAISTTCAN